MARPREFDEDKVGQALMKVFWQNGYDGTSYADIMAATGLKKGSLYAAYGDKRALYRRALSLYDTHVIATGTRMLADDSQSPASRISALFDGVIDTVNTPQGRWGCLLCNAATEAAPGDADTDAAVKAAITRFTSAIRVALPSALKPQAELILSSYFGTRLLVKSGIDVSAVEAVRASVLGLIK